MALTEDGSSALAAAVGSGNIGADLVRGLIYSDTLVPVAVVGNAPDSVGLAMTRQWDVSLAPSFGHEISPGAGPAPPETREP